MLPVNAVNGTQNWGYDGVGWFAVHEPYGGPDGFKAFVDACHRRGLGVAARRGLQPPRPVRGVPAPVRAVLQAGPVDLGRPGQPRRARSRCAATSWTTRRCGCTSTTWTGCGWTPCTRWSTSTRGTSSRSWPPRSATLSAQLRRPLTLIAESDLNDPRLIRSRDAGGYGLTAQWDDDVHHALHALLTGERQGYYADFGSLAALAKAYTGAFVHDGSWSSFRGRVHGRRVDRARRPAYRFVAFLQDHDQVGNRAARRPAVRELDPLRGTAPGRRGAAADLARSRRCSGWARSGARSTPWQFFTSHPSGSWPPRRGRAAGGVRLARLGRRRR